MSIIAKYKFDKSIYENLIPVFNEGYTGYTISDEIDSENSNHVIRTIECDVLPTSMRFGVREASDGYQQHAYSLLSVEYLNVGNLKTAFNMFYRCTNVNKINITLKPTTTNCFNMFAECLKLTSLDVSNWDTSNVTTLHAMFFDCRLLTSIDVSNWDTSNVTGMNHMFYNCQSLTSLDVSNFDTSNVTTMYNMFWNCQSLTSIDVSKWDTSKVTDMASMFYNCNNLTSLDLSNWTINSTSITTSLLDSCGAKTIYMYDSDYASVNRIIEQLPQVDNAELYIGGIDSLGSVNLSGARAKNWSTINKYKVIKYKFDKSIYENLIPIFNNGYTGYTISDEIDSVNSNHVIRTILGNSLPTSIKFTEAKTDSTGSTGREFALIEVYEIDNTKLNTEVQMFHLCNNLVKISGLRSNIIHNPHHMFCGCSSLQIVEGIENWDISIATDMEFMFQNCRSLTSLDISNWNTVNVKNMRAIFQFCNKLTSLDVSNWDTSKVTDMSYMFEGCNKLTSLDVSNWDVSKVTNMTFMFYECKSLTSLDVSNWDTSNVTHMDYTFHGCQSLTSLDVSNWNTGNVINTVCMFYNCISLTSLDVSRWNVENLGTLYRMFHNCKNLEKIDMTNWNIGLRKITNGNQIHTYRLLAGSTKLKEIILPKYACKISYIHDLIAGCLELESIDFNGLHADDVLDNMPDLANPEMKLDFIGLYNEQTTANNSIPKLKRIVTDDVKIINAFIERNQLPDRIGQDTPGYIVTAIRDQIDEETLAALTAKNWVVKDLVAQYVYDANTYENLVPEFNAEFTSDKYEIHDSVSEIVIDGGFKWKNGSIHNSSGKDVIESEDNENQFFINYRKSDFVSVIGNVKLINNYRINSIIYYDESKKYIGYNTGIDIGEGIILPNNAKYIRLTVHKDNTPDYDNLTLTAKLVTRSIESINGDLPLYMRFGKHGDVMVNLNIHQSLISVLALNTNNITTMRWMFQNCRRLTYVNCDFNTSNVTNMYDMFSECHLLTSLDVSNWDVSNVNSMGHMFNNCYKLTTIGDVSNWNTSKVTDMDRIFNSCIKLTNLDVSNWNTSKVNSMLATFCNCKQITSLDLSNWNVSNVTNMTALFNSCDNLQLININNWDMTKVTNTENMFTNDAKLDSVIMYNSNSISINKIINQLPTRTEASKGALVIAGVDDRSLVNVNVAESKFWIVKSRLVAKYTFNKGIYANFLPDMGPDFTSYTIIDEVSPYNANHITRMIVSDSAPQIMKFGADGNDYTKPKALMEVMHVHMDNLRWCYNMFRGCQYVTSINMKNVNTDLMTNMTSMFSMCYNITELDVSSFNTSQVTDMMFVFDDCIKLVNIKGLENWDVSNVTDMHYMFENCSSLMFIPGISEWDVSNVTNMKSMFENCHNLETLYLGAWDVGKVVNMQNMFKYCYKLKTADVSKWDTKNVVDMVALFAECYVIDNLDVSKWNTGKVEWMQYTFANCKALRSLDLSKWNMHAVKRTEHMFMGAKVLTTIGDTNNWNFNNLISTINMFYECNTLTSIGVSNWDTSKVTNMGYMFYKCYALTTLDVSNWDTSHVTDMQYMFFDCRALTSLDVSNWDTSKVLNMSWLFMNCYSVTKLDVSRWNTSNVTNMNHTFGCCLSVNKLDVSRWDTSKVTDMRLMFHNCYKLTSLDVSNWDTSLVTDMYFIFGAYTNDGNTLILERINLGNFKFATNYGGALSGIPNLSHIYVSDIDTIKLLPGLICNRGGKEPGKIMTTLRDQIDEVTINKLSNINWEITDVVAQYVFDANTCEDLMPEFNPEFTADEYEVYDSVNDIVIDNIVWEPGGISDLTGKDVNSEAVFEEFPNISRSNFLPIVGNIEYYFNLDYAHVYVYDKDKNYISHDGMYGLNGVNQGSNTKSVTWVAPSKGGFIRLHRGAGPIGGNITAKLVTRTIESKNGNLPTLMRFGYADNDIENQEYAGPGISLLKVIDLNTKELTTGYRMFKYCKRVESINADWDTSKIVDMFAMFYWCNNLTSLDVSNFDTSNVTDMASMFNGCYNLTSLDVSNWDTGKVTTMFQMFRSCNSLTSLDVSNWDTSNVTNMYAVFCNCQSLTTLDVSKWDTSNVTSMEFMFYACNNLTSLDVSNFNTSNVKNMNEMFYNCNKLTSLDVSNWVTSNVESMRWLFYKCYALTSLDVSNFDTSKVTRMNAMFYYCHELTSIGDVSKWDTSNVDNMSYMFEQCYKLLNIPGIENWDTTNVTTTHGMFWDCHSLTSLDVSNFDTRNVTDISYMFRECKNLTSLDVSGFNTSNVTDMGYMFHGCNKLTSLDVSNFDTSNVIEMRFMFADCKSLTSLDVSKWDVSKVTIMDNMFYNCQSLTSLDVLEWDTSSLRDITSLFYACSNLKSLDVSHWNVDNCGSILGNKTYSMRNVFNDTGLRVLNLNKWSKLEWLYDVLEDGRICNEFIDSTVLKTIDFGNCIIPYYPVNWLKAPNLRYIKCDNGTSVSNLIEQVPTRTEAEPGYIITTAEISDDHKGLFNAKYWNVVDLDEVGTDIAIYKFDKSVYKSLVPVFDNNFADYFIDDVVEDEVNAPNIVTRTIRSMGGLPTSMRFGVSGAYIGRWEESVDDQRSNSLLYVDYINNSDITTMYCMFYGCCYLKNANITVTEKVNNMTCMYYLCHRIESIDTTDWDTGNVKDMSNLFCECYSLTSLDVSGFNTSKVIRMNYMFFDCEKLTSIDVSNFDVSNVTIMGYMFYTCENLTSLDVSRWDTGNVTDMQYMFSGCINLTSLDVSNWDTSNVTNMTELFRDCQSLTSLDVSNWNTSNVNYMANMFRSCINLTSLDVSNWDTGNVTNMMCMFVYCYKLTSLDVSNWDMRKVRRIDWMFGNCQSLTSLNVSKWEFNYMMNISGAFSICKLINNIDVSNWDTSKVTDMAQVFLDCKSLKNIDISGWVINNPVTFNSTFAGLESTSTIDLSNFKIPTTTTFDKMFSNSTGIENIGMIYCDFKTVEKVASVLPTTNHTTIWVGNHIDINGLPQYDHITYKVYEVEDKLEVELSSPLLEGDRLEIIDGDLYHYHNAGIMNLRGYEDWYQGNSTSGWTYRDGCALPFHTYIYKNIVGVSENEIMFYKAVTGEMTDHSVFEFMKTNNLNFVFDNVNKNLYTDNISLSRKTDSNNYVSIRKNGVENVEEFKSWLKSNPVTLLCKLANPYYELVKPNVGLLNAEQGLYLNISDSVVPVVNHQDLCTLKLNYLLPNVQYKVKFKANNPGSIAINLGGTLVPLDIVEGWNEVMVTTPETLVDEYLKVNGSEGIKIQNVMVIDSDKDFDYFKGMNNTFDEIPVKNICKNRTLTYTHGVDEEGVSPQGEMNVNVSKGKVVTVVGKVSNNPNNLPISINLYNDDKMPTGKNLLDVKQYNYLSNVTIEYLENNSIHIKSTIESTWQAVVYKPILSPNTNYTLSCIGEELSGRLLVDAYDGTKWLNGITSDYQNKRFSFNSGNGDDIKINFFCNNIHERQGEAIFTNIQLEEGITNTAYEPPEYNVNDESIFINPDENGYFAITIRADRDYANRIGFNVGDASSCEENDQVTITDLMVFEGDILDCHPTTYVDPADTRYLVEYKSIGNPFGFGKNKLI